MPRETEKWVGKHDDSMPPPRVRLRIFERYGGVCQISGRKIQAGDKWALDHVLAIVNGGANNEDNLVPVLEEPHKEKTKQDVKIKAKNARVRKKHLGLHKPKNPLPGSKGSKWKMKVGGGVVPRD